MPPYTELAAWKHGHLLVLDIYRLTSLFPEEERFGITAQLRRAVVSVAANIACAAASPGAEADEGPSRLFEPARSSLTEVEYLLIASGDLGFAPAEECARIRNEVQILGCMVVALRAKAGTSGVTARAKGRFGQPRSPSPPAPNS